MPAYKDGKTGKWYCQFYYEDWQGKRRHKVKRGFDRKKDADKWELDFKSNTHNEVITMSALINEYMVHLDGKVSMGIIKRSSRATIARIINGKIAPYFKDMDASKIKTKHVNEFLVYVSNGRRLTPEYVNSVKNKLSQIFKFAMHNYGLKENPVANAEIAKYTAETNDTRTKMVPLEDYIKLCDSVKKPEHKLVLDIMYWGGLRIGEVFALTPGDISPYKITVSKTLTFDVKPYIDTPKTTSSAREIEIPRFLYYRIKDYTDRMYDKSIPLFNFTPGTIRSLISRRAKALGLPNMSPHTLRHSYASTLLNITKDAAVVSRQLGHANPNITLSIYSHMLPGENRKAVDEMEEKLSQITTIETGK